MAVLNLFRDLHWEYTKTRYMISWARDSKLAKEMLGTYSPDTLKDMMNIFFTQPHRQYSMPTLHRAIPEIVLIIEDIRKKELRQKKCLVEASAFQRYAEAHAQASKEQESALAGVEVQVEEITSEGSQAIISNPALRQKLEDLQKKITGIWEDIHLRAVAVSGLPRELRTELEKVMNYDVSTARDAALELAANRKRKGGDVKRASNPDVPP
jgi:hypothetical protein